MRTAQVSDSYGLDKGIFEGQLNVLFWGFVERLFWNGIFTACALKWDTAGHNIYTEILFSAGKSDWCPHIFKFYYIWNKWEFKLNSTVSPAMFIAIICFECWFPSMEYWYTLQAMLVKFCWWTSVFTLLEFSTSIRYLKRKSIDIWYHFWYHSEN